MSARLMRFILAQRARNGRELAANIVTAPADAALGREVTRAACGSFMKTIVDEIPLEDDDDDASAAVEAPSCAAKL